MSNICKKSITNDVVFYTKIINDNKESNYLKKYEVFSDKIFFQEPDHLQVLKD